jgi:hypothetical protein
VKRIYKVSHFAVVYRDEHHRPMWASPDKIAMGDHKFSPIAEHDPKWMERIGIP